MCSYTTLWFIVITTCFRLSLFFDINVSQGSVVTFVRCGAIFNADFIANLLTSQPVKDYESRPTSDEVIVKVKRVIFFRHRVVFYTTDIHWQLCYLRCFNYVAENHRLNITYENNLIIKLVLVGIYMRHCVCIIDIFLKRVYSVLLIIVYVSIFHPFWPRHPSQNPFSKWHTAAVTRKQTAFDQDRLH